MLLIQPGAHRNDKYRLKPCKSIFYEIDKKLTEIFA